MKTKKTTLISTERHESLTVRLNLRTQSHPKHILCEKCRAEAPVYELEEAAVFGDLSVPALKRMVEDGLLHFKEMPGGLLLICLNNLDGREPDTETSTP